MNTNPERRERRKLMKRHGITGKTYRRMVKKARRFSAEEQKAREIIDGILP